MLLYYVTNLYKSKNVVIKLEFISQHLFWWILIFTYLFVVWSMLTGNKMNELENSAVATGLEKVSFYSIPKESQWQRMLKLRKLHSSHKLIPGTAEPGGLPSMGSHRIGHDWSDLAAAAAAAHVSKVMLKILQARLQQYVNCELPDVQADFRKGRGTRDQILATSAGSKKQESSRKTSISAFLAMLKPLTVWITINCEKFWKRWAYQTTWPASWETYMQVRKQQLEVIMEQQTSSK